MLDAKQNTREDIVMVLVGNKRDRDDKCGHHAIALPAVSRNRCLPPQAHRWVLGGARNRCNTSRAVL